MGVGLHVAVRQRQPGGVEHDDVGGQVELFTVGPERQRAELTAGQLADSAGDLAGVESFEFVDDIGQDPAPGGDGAHGLVDRGAFGAAWFVAGDHVEEPDGQALTVVSAEHLQRVEHHPAGAGALGADLDDLHRDVELVGQVVGDADVFAHRGAVKVTNWPPAATTDVAIRFNVYDLPEPGWPTRPMHRTGHGTGRRRAR